MDTTNNTAHDYALLIKAEIVALDTLLECWADIAGISADDIDELAGNGGDDIRESLAALDMSWPDDEDTDIVADYLNDTCLSLDVWRKVDERNGATRLEILRTCGGPRCDILRDSDDGSIIEIRVYSGSETYTLRVNAGTLADALDEIGGCY